MRVLLWLVGALGTVGAYPSGSPRCQMRPGHGRQGYGLSPEILFASECYTPGLPIRVTLTGAKSFHGFVLRGPQSQGQFAYSGYNFRLAASKDHCITHDSSSAKSMVDAEWTPSDGSSGDVMFEAVIFVSSDPYAQGRAAAQGDYQSVTKYLSRCQSSGAGPDRWVAPSTDSATDVGAWDSAPSWSSAPQKSRRGYDNPSCLVDESNSCDSWVSGSPSECSQSSSYVYKSCQQSCCNYDYCTMCVGQSARQSPWSSSSSSSSWSSGDCSGLPGDSNPSCSDWATSSECNDPASWVSTNCKYNCCKAKQTGGAAKPSWSAKPSVSFSIDGGCSGLSDDSGYASQCPVWVKDNPSNCQGNYFEATSCKRSCCLAGSSSSSSSWSSSSSSSSSSWTSSSSSSSSEPSAYCLASYPKNEAGCEDWVKSAADCAVGTYMYGACHRSCCELGVYVDTAPFSSSSSSSGHSSGTEVCEIDYDPGTFDCPPGQSPFQESKLVWYHCPYCRKCKMFRWSGCGGNSNRFETERECQNRCESANPWTKSLVDKTGGSRRPECAGKVNTEPIDMEPICDGMVALNPQLCGQAGWVAENCLASCCQANYNRR